MIPEVLLGHEEEGSRLFERLLACATNTAQNLARWKKPAEQRAGAAEPGS